MFASTYLTTALVAFGMLKAAVGGSLERRIVEPALVYVEALQGLALTLEDTTFLLEELGQSNESSNRDISTIIGTLKNVTAGNDNEGTPNGFEPTGLFTQAEQYTILTNVLNLVVIEKRVIRELIRKKKYFQPQKATLRAYFNSLDIVAEAFYNDSRTFAPDLAPAFKIVFGSITPNADAAKAVFT